MRTGIEILRDIEVVLHVTCACDRQRCLVCARRREVAAYLDVADAKSKRQPLAVVP